MYEDKLKQFQEIVRFREISRRYSILLHVLLTFVTDISDSIFWISFRQFYATLQELALIAHFPAEYINV